MNIHEYQAKIILRKQSGIEKVVEIAMDKDTKAQFDTSVAAVRELIGAVDSIQKAA